MEYFFTPPHLIGPGELSIEGDEYAHLTHVMRKKAGDEVVVVDGAGHAYHCVVLATDHRAARCRITAHTEFLHEPTTRVALGVGILKNSSSFDFLVEKSTELGVAEIVPLLTERTIPRHAKSDRWQKLALAAMKQSGRCVLPRVHHLTSLPLFLKSASRTAARLIPYENSATPFPAITDTKPSSVVLCIGPEGGFTDQEIQGAETEGFHPVTLGPRRLRTETAAIIAVAKALGV